ncbi:MAG: hypothetical protein ABI651_17095, partial [Verrucomicrobiota bacterium]
ICIESRRVHTRPQVSLDIKIVPTSLPKLMTVELAEALLVKIEAKIALRHRFAGDRGTILRLDNHAMINIFDDGRYYIQGSNTEMLIASFSQVEQPWDPDSWDGGGPEQLLPWWPPPRPTKRFEF